MKILNDIIEPLISLWICVCVSVDFMLTHNWNLLHLEWQQNNVKVYIELVC